jgi:hypothetical protein
MAERYVANDLAELKGIGPKYETINRRHGEVVGIGLNQLKVWVEEAKSHSSQ